MSRSRAAPLLAALFLGCAAPSARISRSWLDGPKPQQAVVRCEIDGLPPPIHVAWKLAPEVKQIGWDVPSKDERALLVQVPDRDAWVECVAVGGNGVSVKAQRSLRAPTLAAPPTKLRPGEVVTIRGGNFGRARANDDAVYLVPAWGAATPLDHACKSAAWSDGAITACVPSDVSGTFELRVQSGGDLARAPSLVMVGR